MLQSVPFFPMLNCLSPLNADTWAFSIWTVSPFDMEFIWSFHKHSLIVPVSSATRAFKTVAYFPNRVKTGFGFGISMTLALKLTCFIPIRKSLMRWECIPLFFLFRSLCTMSISIIYVIGFFRSMRISLDIGNWATTLEPSEIKKMASSCVLPRHCIESSLHVVFCPSHAELNASKKMFGLSSYFTVRKARYSLADALFLKAFLPFSHVFALLYSSTIGLAWLPAYPLIPWFSPHVS